MGRNGANVHGARLRPLRGQFNAEHRTLKRCSVRSQLDAAAASTVENEAVGQVDLHQRLRSKGGDLPRRCQRASFVGVMKKKALRSRCVLSLLDQSLGRRVNG